MVVRTKGYTKQNWLSRVALGVACALFAFGAAQAMAGEAMSDMDITEAVEDEFLFDQAVELNQIDVDTNEGIVTLTGSVDNILEKQRAANLSGTVKGVRAVVNDLDVIPAILRDDVDIQSDVNTALLLDPATESYEVNTDVENSQVTLTGTVQSWQEKQLAERVAKNVKGVTAVENNIAVDYETDRADVEIEPEIQKRLRWDALVDHALINVEVEDGNVTLSGTVGSAAEKSRAAMDAWVAGVKSVDSDNLEVELWARDERLRKNKYAIKSDAAVEEAIEDAFLYDPRVMSFDVTANVDAGIATLRGVVDNVRAKRAAAQDAKHTVGVVSVENRIRVRPSTPTDAEIADNIRDAIRRNPYVERYEIDVTVVNGIAYLNGIVDSYFEKGEADDIASTVYGVEGIRNNLEVDYADEPLVYNPYIYDIDPYDYEWYDYRPNYTFRSDAEIADRIDDEMLWSPYVDSTEVDVSVDDGTATLTGTVETAQERMNATEEAYEGGATWVYNNITLD